MGSIKREAAELAHSRHSLDEMYRAYDGLLRRYVPYAAAAWSTVDPATGLFTSCQMSGIERDPAAAAKLFSFEFSDDEPATYAHIVKRGKRATTSLWEETGGELDRAGRYRELLSHVGLTDELRAVFVSDGVWWGNVVLYRLDGRFTHDERELVEAITSEIAVAVRTSMLGAAAQHPEIVRDPPGILLVGPGDTVRPMTDTAARWTREAGEDRLHSTALAAGAALRSRDDWPATSARVRARGGQWLSLQATRVEDDPDTVAVIVDLARPAEVADVLLDAYQLSPRQRDVLELVLRGRSATQIAGALDIATHTANDHLKAIYRRVGVSSRAELAALLQAEQYDPRKYTDVPPSPYGWFLEA